jgi:CRP-like cAMP-binding protein
VFSVPFVIAFTPGLLEVGGIVALQTLIDVGYLFDILLSLRTSFFNLQSGDEIFNLRLIAKRYLKSGRLVFDLLAAFPFDRIVFSLDPKSSAWKTLALLRIIRVSRLQNMLTHIRVGDEVKLVIKLMQLLLYLIMYVHVIGCWWFMLICENETWLPPTDIIRGTTEIYNSGAWNQYWYSFYHSVYLLVGIEIMVTQGIEYCFTVIFYICGAIINALVIGEMASIISNLNRKALHFAEIADNANTMMKNMKLPDSLQLKVYDYLVSTQYILEQKNELEAFDKMIPPTLQQQVRASYFKGIVNTYSLFSDDSKLAEAATKLFKPQFWQPDEAVVSFGEDSTCMFFVASGKCEVEVIDQYKTAHLVRYIRTGDYFGELGLVYNTQRTATVTTSVYSSLAQLSKAGFMKLADDFPEIKESFKTRVTQYKDPYRCFLKSCLNRIVYFQGLPETLLDSLIYSMESRAYDAESIIIGEAEATKHILFVIEGSLSLSFKARYTDPQALVQIEDEHEWQGWDALSRKNRDQVFFNLHRPSTLKKEKYAELFYLDLGGIIGARQVLIETSNVLRIMSRTQSTVTRLSLASIESLSKSNAQLLSQVQSAKNALRGCNAPSLLDCSPMFPIDQDLSAQRKTMLRLHLKSVILAVIKRCREIRMVDIPNISRLLSKLKAIVQAEEQGQESIALKIATGELDYGAICCLDLLSFNDILNPLIIKFAVAAHMGRQVEDFVSQKFSEVMSYVTEQQKEMQRFADNTEEFRDMVCALEKLAFSGQ